MERYNKPTNKTPIQWVPEEPLRIVLNDSILSKVEDGSLIEEYVELYRRFRDPEPDEILSFPENPVSHSDLYEDLFSVEGSFKQMNLDNIGKDFLCFILHTQYLRENFKTKGPDSIVRFLIDDRGQTNEFNNLNNSILRVEVLFNFMSEEGVDLTENLNLTEREYFVLFTDSPKRRLSDDEIRPVEWIVGTSRFSKMIRRCSVLLQEREVFESVSKRTNPIDFKLPKGIKYLNGDMTHDSHTDSIRISLNREFRLWDRFRRLGYPSIRDISNGTRIPYILLIGLRDRTENPIQYTGTSLLTRIPVRVATEIVKCFSK